MQKLEIKKKSGGVRVIYAPSKTEKRWLRKKLGELNEIMVNLLGSLPVHGFVPHRSPVTNALPHRSLEWSLSFDLKDFFDSVTLLHLQEHKWFVESWQKRMLVDGATRQGLPTSPILANIAAIPMDKAILARLKPGVVYTRYADDLTFSSNVRSDIDEIKVWLPEVTAEFKFALNAKKTRTQWSGFGRRVITGVAVDKGIHPTRSVRRRLRAALHQGNGPQIGGLSEWCQLKQPGLTSNRERLRNVRHARRLLRKK